VTCTCNYLRCRFALAAGTAGTNKVATLRLFDPSVEACDVVSAQASAGGADAVRTKISRIKISRMKCHNQLL
jgi:hypothetical protein